MRSDKAWNLIGGRDPYFGVASHSRFSGGANRDEFFRGGEEYVANLMAMVREFVPNFQPQRAVDFGCGVGRLVIPLSRECKSVVGVDVSTGMLAEARRNCGSAANIDFVSSPEALQGPFDFIHSFIVFQHIPVRQGLRLMAALVDRLEDKGVGALHFVYANTRSTLKHFTYRLRQIPGLLALANVSRHLPASYPPVQMNAYPLRDVFKLLQSRGCNRLGGSFTDHDGHLGTVLLFQRARGFLSPGPSPS